MLSLHYYKAPVYITWNGDSTLKILKYSEKQESTTSATQRSAISGGLPRAGILGMFLLQVDRSPVASSITDIPSVSRMMQQTLWDWKARGENQVQHVLCYLRIATRDADQQ